MGELDFISAYSKKVERVLRATMSGCEDEGCADEAAGEAALEVREIKTDFNDKTKSITYNSLRHFGYFEHADEQRIFNRRGGKRAPVMAHCHKAGCLWNRTAIDPDAYGPPLDVCTCGPWYVRMISAPTACRVFGRVCRCQPKGVYGVVALSYERKSIACQTLDEELLPASMPAKGIP